MTRKTCSECKKQEATCAAVVGGTYLSQLCLDCKNDLTLLGHIDSGGARWNRDIDVTDHEVDIAQPWGSDGKPNPTFIRAYPDKARHHFTDEEMRKYG
jgi:hypothetical protein